MARDGSGGLDWTEPPVMVTVARLLCRELTLANEYLLGLAASSGAEEAGDDSRRRPAQRLAAVPRG